MLQLFKGTATRVVLILVVMLCLGLVLDMLFNKRAHAGDTQYSTFFLCKNATCSNAYTIYADSAGKSFVNLLTSHDSKYYAVLLKGVGSSSMDGLYRADYHAACKNMLKSNERVIVRMGVYPGLLPKRKAGPGGKLRKAFTPESCAFKLYRISNDTSLLDYFSGYIAAKQASWMGKSL